MSRQDNAVPGEQPSAGRAVRDGHAGCRRRHIRDPA